MFKKSTWLHLRIPFSFFLLPVYLFAVSVSPNLNPERLLLVFAALHLFLYPASNGYNSYFDKDERSIGGLKHPPKVTRGLYFTSLLFDLAALTAGALINATFVGMIFIYGMVSKVYSHPSVRIKKYPWLSWFIAGLFQGWFTFLMAYAGINDFDIFPLLKWHVQVPALLTSLILWGSYPMTQIYQHDEDAGRGDHTLSIKLGILGTFRFTAVVFIFSCAAFFIYFQQFFHIRYSLIFLVVMLPVAIYFCVWYMRVLSNLEKADYAHVMRLNMLSACCLNGFFLYFFLDSTQVIQAIKGGF